LDYPEMQDLARLVDDHDGLDSEKRKLERRLKALGSEFGKLPRANEPEGGQVQELATSKEELRTKLAGLEVERARAWSRVKMLSERHGGPEAKWLRRNLVRRLLTVRRGKYRNPGGRSIWRRRPVPETADFQPLDRLACDWEREEKIIDGILKAKVGDRLEADAMLRTEDVALLLMALGIEEPDQDNLQGKQRETPANYLERLNSAVSWDWSTIVKELGGYR